MKAVDDRPVWAIVASSCRHSIVPEAWHGRFSTERSPMPRRRRGAAGSVPGGQAGRSNDDSMWFGAKSMYERPVEEVARRKPTRPIVRIRAAAGRISPEVR